MIIYWEDIRWEVDDAGTSWATLADEEHNSLTLENRDGKITFHTEGTPRFDARRILEITALCMILEEDALAEPDAAGQGRVTARSSDSRDADTFIPGQRHAPDPKPGDMKPEATPLAQASSSGREASRRVLPLPIQSAGVRGPNDAYRPSSARCVPNAHSPRQGREQVRCRVPTAHSVCQGREQARRRMPIAHSAGQSREHVRRRWAHP
jgi:hypothetical protein